ncbi:MAG: hypothetical protein R3Y56_03455 [Akkermansia sp.]
MAGFSPWKSLVTGLITVSACAVFGMLMMPINQQVKLQLKSEGLIPEQQVALGRDALSQQLALFAMGGLRSLAAQILSLDATAAWIKQDWPTIERRYEQITTLCPQRINYWVNASFEMATNAAAYKSYEDSQQSEIEQSQTRRRYFLRGEQFLQDGIRNNPSSVLLHAKLGDLHSNLYRYPRFLQAANAYQKAVELGAPPIYERLQFYSLCRVHGQEQKAWELGRALFDKYPQQRVPSLRCLLFMLQNRLQVPDEQKLSVEELFGSQERALRQLRAFIRNDLRYPTTGVAEYLEPFN